MAAASTQGDAGAALPELIEASDVWARDNEGKNALAHAAPEALYMGRLGALEALWAEMTRQAKRPRGEGEPRCASGEDLALCAQQALDAVLAGIPVGAGPVAREAAVQISALLAPFCSDAWIEARLAASPSIGKGVPGLRQLFVAHWEARDFAKHLGQPATPGSAAPPGAARDAQIGAQKSPIEAEGQKTAKKSGRRL